jgi:hypothetical protein
MNKDFQLDEAEALAESPVLYHAPGMPVHVWVGAVERPVFIEQAGMLARVWDAGLTVEAERHHFDVVEGLADPGSALVEVLLG